MGVQIVEGYVNQYTVIGGGISELKLRMNKDYNNPGKITHLYLNNPNHVNINEIQGGVHVKVDLENNTIFIFRDNQ